MPSTKIIFASDFHIGPNQYDPTHQQRAFKSLEWLFDTIEDRHPDLVVLGGDLFHDVTKVRFFELGPVIKFLRDVKRLGCTTVAIAGNHDIHSSMVGDSVVEALPYVIPVTDFLALDVGGEVLGFLAYNGTLPDVMDTPFKAIFTHKGVRHPSLPEWLGGGSIDEFKTPYVFSGHYHIPVQVKSKKSKLVYSGAFLPRGFSEAGDHKFGILEIIIRDSVKWRRIENPHAARYMNEMSEIPGYQTFVQVSISPNEVEPIGSDNLVVAKVNYTADLDPDPEILEFQHTGDANATIQAFVSEQANLSIDHSELIQFGMRYYNFVSVRTVRKPWIVNSIRIENFMALRGRTVVTFNDGITLVEGTNQDEGGSNGSGKSSLLEAIYWALYGNTIRSSEHKDDVVNWFERSAHVELTMSCDDETIQIKRTRTKGNRSSLLITHNGTQLTFQKILEAGKWIVDTIGVDETLFKTTVLFSKRSMDLAEATPATRAAGFMQFLGYGFQDAWNKVNVEGKETAMLIAGLQSAKKTWEATVAGKIEVLSKICHDAEMALDNESDIRKQYKQKKKRIEDDLMRTYKSRKELVKEEPVNISNLHKKVSELQQQMATIRLSKKEGDGVLSEQRRVLQKHKALLGFDVCPTCSTPLNQSDIKEVHHILEEEFNESSSKIISKQAQHDLLLQRLETKIKVYETRIAEHSKTQFEVASFDSRMDALKIELEQIRTTYKSKIHEIRSRKRWIETKRNEIVELKESTFGDQNKLDQLVHLSKIQEFWKYAFSRDGIPNYLLRQTIKFANTQLAKYLDTMSTGVSAAFHVNKGLVHIRVYGRQNRLMTYMCLSDGQQACVNLAVQFALHDVQRLTLGGLAFMVFDEAIGHLDSFRASASMQLLKCKLGLVKSILFITHRADVEFDDAPAHTRLRAVLSKGQTRYQKL